MSSPSPPSPCTRAIRWLIISHQRVCPIAVRRSPTRCGLDRETPLDPFGLSVANWICLPAGAARRPQSQRFYVCTANPPFGALNAAFCEQVRCRCAMSRLRAVQHHPQPLYRPPPHSCMVQDRYYEIRLSWTSPFSSVLLGCAARRGCVWPASHHGYVSTVTGVFSVYIHIVLDGLRILEPSSTKALLLRGVRCLVSVRCVVLVR